MTARANADGILPEYEDKLVGRPSKDDAKKYEGIIDNAIRALNNNSVNKWPVSQAGGVKRIFPPDERGFVEVLFLDSDNNPQTAYVKNRDAHFQEGW